MPLTFDQPNLLWGMLPAALVIYYLARRSLAGLGPVRWWAAVLTRFVVATLILMALAGVHRKKVNKNLSVIFLTDVSRSVPIGVRDEAWAFVQRVNAEPPKDDRVGVLAFDGEAYIEQLPQPPGGKGGLYIDKLAPPLQPERTDLAKAVRLATAMFPDDAAKRMVILTDGNQTEGDVLTELRTAVAAGVAVDILPLRYEHRNEVMFESLAAPSYAHVDEYVPLRMLIRSERRTSGRIELYHNGQLIDLDRDTPGPNGQPVVLEPGTNPFVVSLPIKNAAAHRFESRFVPDKQEDDSILNNNVATAFTNVEGPATVLFLHHSYDDGIHRPEDDELLIQALRDEKINVDVMQPAAISLDPVTLQQYSAVILANVPADELTDSEHQSLATYTRDLGGGLIMVGGDDSFGAGGWQGSVVEAVMPVRFDVDEKKQIPRGALVLIMHACEFPQGNLWATEVGIKAMKTLSRLDYFGMIDWSGFGTTWAVPLRLADDKGGIERQIRKMANNDMPDYDEPMRMAYKGLRARTDAAQKHVIMISDGDAGAPSNKTLNDFRGANITVSTISIFPHGGNEIATLKRIADQTGGNYYSIAAQGDEKKLPQIFVKEAKIVRRPLIREERFTPRAHMTNSELMEGVGNEVPSLLGYVVTTPRPASEIVMPLVTDKGDPLLAHWICGLGRSVAFTSGWWSHWGSDWAAWSRYSKLWAQTVRWSMSRGSAANFEVTTRVTGKRGKVVIEALNKDMSFLNFLQMRGAVVGPDGEAKPINLRQTGPGVYESEFEAQDAGNYLVTVQAKGGADEEPALIRTGVSISYSREYRDLGPNESMLVRMSEVGASNRMLNMDSTEDEIFAHNLPESIARLPIWHELAMLALALFILDVAIRRIAVDVRATWRRAVDMIIDPMSRSRAGGRAEAVLGGLRATRDRVKAEQTSSGSPTASGVDRTRKFDAGASVASKPSADLRKSLGGAEAAPPPSVKPAAKPGDASKAPESTMSRLLKTKRRAQSDGTDDDQAPQS